jgi:hypothetical protein
MTWTQDEAIAFECARECISDLMAIRSREIADEETRPRPDAARLAALEADLDRLAGERSALRGTDHAEIARIRTEYGALIRTIREERRRQHAA